MTVEIQENFVVIHNEHFYNREGEQKILDYIDEYADYSVGFYNCRFEQILISGYEGFAVDENDNYVEFVDCKFDDCEFNSCDFRGTVFVNPTFERHMTRFNGCTWEDESFQSDQRTCFAGNIRYADNVQGLKFIQIEDGPNMYTFWCYTYNRHRMEDWFCCVSRYAGIVDPSFNLSNIPDKVTIPDSVMEMFKVDMV